MRESALIRGRNSSRMIGFALRGRPIRGRTIVVTGASSGIGAALARALAVEGAKLVLAARREELLRPLADECRKLGAEGAVAWPTDVTSARSIELACAAAVEQFGRLDVLVQNAGRGHYASVEKTPPKELREIFETNFVSAWVGAQAALAIMRPQGSGHIVNVSSVVGHRAPPFMGAYAASKAAMNALGESLRIELAGTKILVSTVLPGSTSTPFFESATGEQKSPLKKPLGWVQTPEKVARAIVRTIRRPRPEVYTRRANRAIHLLNAAFPRLVDWGMRRFIGRLGGPQPG